MTKEKNDFTWNVLRDILKYLLMNCLLLPFE